jgi:hypothetical protein
MHNESLKQGLLYNDLKFLNLSATQGDSRGNAIRCILEGDRIGHFEKKVSYEHAFILNGYRDEV